MHYAQSQRLLEGVEVTIPVQQAMPIPNYTAFLSARHYSCRNAVIGSTRAARRAGM